MGNKIKLNIEIEVRSDADELEIETEVFLGIKNLFELYRDMISIKGFIKTSGIRREINLKNPVNNALEKEFI